MREGNELGGFHFGSCVRIFLFRNSPCKTDGKFLKLAALARDMLHPMQLATESAPSATAASFAGLLAALTSPKAPPEWNDDALADDVATLSYENALRTHARYRALDPTGRSLTEPVTAEREQVDSYELASVEEARKAQSQNPFVSPQSALHATPEAYRRAPASFERHLKSASITIRMSKEESAQLHRRASEAGLTVSAYLRSCTFEAESLRAMVKDTMAQLKAATSAGKQAAPTPGRRSLGERMIRFFAPWRASRRMARA